MGLSLEFHRGDSATIRQAITAGRSRWFRDPILVSHSADFSLHIEPADLDLLSETIDKVLRHTPRKLRPSLTPIVDTKLGGVLAVAPEWVTHVAEVQRLRPLHEIVSKQDLVAEVATGWASAMRLKHAEDVPVTEAMGTAISRLVELCAVAHASKGEVFHIWYL
jgi:hypothetical protein